MVGSGEVSSAGVNLGAASLVPEDGPSVLLASQRLLRPKVSRCVAYEFERLIASMSRVDWAVLRHGVLGHFPEVAVNRLNKRFTAAAGLKPVMPTIEPAGSYDLMCAVVQIPSDIVALNAIKDWRERCDKAVLFVEEMWASELDKWKGHIEQMNRFDHVFVAAWGTVEALAERVDVPVSYLPYGVDSLEFAPADVSAQRFIDVCNIGRRSEVTHRALLEWANHTDRFYYYDSFSPGDFYGVEEHRAQLARLMRASNVAITNRGIGARAHETGGQEELGFRFFEAAAAGALMVGSPPETPVVAKLFDWEDAIIPVAFDAPMIADLIEELDAQPDRVLAARRRNVSNALLRHDHVHRWEAMLEAVDIEPGAAADARKATLVEIADAL